MNLKIPKCECGCGSLVKPKFPRFIRGHKAKGFGKKDPVIRFWKKVQKTDDCWIWLGSKNKKGHGTFFLTKERPVGAHRYSYWLATGDEPGDLFVCHRCDNPSCVRPDHLFLGTNTDNMRDAKAKGRLERKTCKRGLHTLVEGNIRENDSERRCKACDNEARRKRYHANHAQWRQKKRAYERIKFGYKPLVREGSL